MVAKAALFLPVLMALANQAQAVFTETDWITVWETVTVTDDQAAAVSSTPSSNAAVSVLLSTPAVSSAPESTPTTLATLVKPSSNNPAAKEALPISSVPAAAPQLSSVAAPAASSTPIATQPAAAPLLSISLGLGGLLPTPSSAPQPSNAPGLGFSKRGIAYNQLAMAQTLGGECPNCGWMYNWDSSAGGTINNVNYVPMLWSTAAIHTNNWQANAESAISQGSKALFSFNEPDNAGQANLSPSDAAAGHIQYLNQFSGQTLIGAPSVTNSGTPGQGLDWLQQWITACNSQGGCKYDFCNVHWYSGAQYADTLFTHIENAYKLCNKPIWLTEFAPTGASDADTTAFLTSVLPQLESTSYLQAYSYFMAGPDSLLDNSGALSSFGQTYAAHP